MISKNYWYKGQLFTIEHIRADYDWRKRTWNAYQTIDSHTNLICSSTVSLKDIRGKVRQYVDSQPPQT